MAVGGYRDGTEGQLQAGNGIQDPQNIEQSPSQKVIFTDLNRRLSISGSNWIFFPTTSTTKQPTRRRLTNKSQNLHNKTCLTHLKYQSLANHSEFLMFTTHELLLLMYTGIVNWFLTEQSATSLPVVITDCETLIRYLKNYTLQGIEI